jgi:hypothetical protein
VPSLASAANEAESIDARATGAWAAPSTFGAQVARFVRNGLDAHGSAGRGCWPRNTLSACLLPGWACSSLERCLETRPRALRHRDRRRLEPSHLHAGVDGSCCVRRWDASDADRSWSRFVDDVQLQVSPELDSSEPFEETFVRAERAATAILTRLPETPVRAFGINLGFVVDESCALLEAVLLPPDGPALLAAGVRVGATSIVRRLLVDGGIVNLTVTTGETATGRPLRLDFNHHSDTVSSELAIGTIPGALGRAWGISVHLAREVYGIEQVKHEH